MLISYTHNFLFIHVGKAAGTSIQRALEPFAQALRHVWCRRRLPLLGAANRIGGLYRAVDFRVHAGTRELRRCLPPEVYVGLLKFTFVRNPWDMLVSRYSFLMQDETHHQHRFVKAMSRGFEEYVEWEVRSEKRLQYPCVTDQRGALIVDFIGRFENLEADFAQVCRRIGVWGGRCRA